MPETLTITGACTEISEKNGWTAFAVDVGRQYPVKLSTKKTEVIDAGRAAGTQVATWTYTEVESDRVNEHTGKPYVNRYLESVDVGGTMTEAAAQPAATGAAQPAAPTHAPLPPGDKDRAITRMAVLKAAAEVVAAKGTTDDPGAEVIALAARFETWVYRDTGEIPF